ncbi:hypothetical protein H6G27_33405 [Nostoc linckia FACHB-104]|nr:hypothetical protein [Nostoc linckia FACHB-104]
MMRKIAVEFLDDNSKIEIACYGADSDWVCRLTDPLTQPKGSVSDAFAPFPDLGFLWFREVGDRAWVVSGMVNRSVFQDEAWLDDLLYRISNEIYLRDYSPARRIEFVSVDVTAMFDGERGRDRFRGGEVEKGWQRKWQGQQAITPLENDKETTGNS